MVLCYKYLKHHVFYNTALALPFFTKKDLFKNSKVKNVIYATYQYATESVQLLVVISCFLAIPSVWSNIDVLCGCLASAAHSLQIIAKTIHLKVSHKAFVKHLNEFESALENNKNVYQDARKQPLRFEEYFHKKSSHVRSTQVIHFAAQIISTSIYFIPFLHKIITHRNVEELNLPVVGLFPFDLSEYPGFFCAFMMQLLAFYQYNTKMVAIDYFIMDVIVLHSSQIEFLEQLIDGLLVAYENGVIEDGKKDYFLKQWIVQHQESTRFCNRLRPILSNYLIIEYLYAFTHTCIPAFVITSTTSWGLYQKVAVLSMISSGLIALFLLAAAGNTFNSVGVNLEKTLYGEWLSTWDKMQLTFRMYSCHQYRPCYLKFASLFPLCFPTFISICRLILTYYMTLNEVQSMKKEN